MLRPFVVLAAIALGLVVAPGDALACSCWRIAGIGTALTKAETVVVGRVERRLEARTPQDYQYDLPVVVKVHKVLKGNADAEILVTNELMCYQSFVVDDLKPGETFVFPLHKYDEPGLYVLPLCSDTALRLVDGELFNQLNLGAGSKAPIHYMSLRWVERLLPWGLLNPHLQILIAGSIGLLVPMLIAWRVRPRSGLEPLRPLRLRSKLAIAWMLVCAALSLFIGWDEPEWKLLVFGGAFCAAAVGMALGWRWTEGLSYGVAVVWIGISVVSMYMVFRLVSALGKEGNPKALAILSILVLNAAVMIWCADTVRRRFSPDAEPQSSQPAA